MTYVDMNGNFGALGHGISDSDTGELVVCEGGELYRDPDPGNRKGPDRKAGSHVRVIYYGKEQNWGSEGEYDRRNIRNRKPPFSGFNNNRCDSRRFPTGYSQGNCVHRSNVSGGSKDYEIEIQEGGLRQHSEK